MVNTVKVADQREFANCLYYGDGGTGKTTALASLANLGRTLYVDAESGIKRHPLARLGVNVDNLELLKFEGALNFQELEEAFWQVKSELDDDPDSWAGVVWDSGTEIYHALLDSIVGQRVEKAKRSNDRGRNVSEMMSDRFFIDRDNYGVMSEQIRFLLRRFRDLPCHFGIAFLERRDTDERTGRVRVGPAITPGLQSDVIGWHDVVCRTTFDNTTSQYLGTFRPEGVHQGKDRYGMLPVHMVNPSMERVVAYISGELDETADQQQKQGSEGEAAQSAGEEAQDNGTTSKGKGTTAKASNPMERAKAAAAARAGAQG